MARYDVAQICLNGHLINYRHIEYPDSSRNFCPDCGAKTIIGCPHCNKQIRGADRDDYVSGEFPVPKFCEYCGSPYPWTESRLNASKELVKEFNQISDEEKDVLEESIENLVRNSPAVPLAASRFKRIVSKAGPEAMLMLRELMTGIISESIKKLIFQ